MFSESLGLMGEMGNTYTCRRLMSARGAFLRDLPGGFIHHIPTGTDEEGKSDQPNERPYKCSEVELCVNTPNNSLIVINIINIHVQQNLT